MLKGLSRRVDDVIVEKEKIDSIQIKFANSKIVTIKNWSELNIQVFVSKGKKVLLKRITDISNLKVSKFVKQIIESVEKAPEKPYYYGIAKGPFKFKKTKYEKRFDSADLVGMTEQAIDVARGRCAGVLYAEKSERELISNKNIHARDKSTAFNFSIRVFGKNSGHGVSYSSDLKSFKPEKASNEASYIANLCSNTVPFKEGKYNVLLHPMIAANLLSSFSYAFSAFEVEAKNSFLEGMVNKKVSSSIFSLYDNGRRITAFDEEGRPTKRTLLISKGVLKTYLHNTSTAKYFNSRPTSNAGLLYPSPWFFEVSSGSYSLEELLEEMRNGIYLTNTWYTRFTNYRTGDFSTIPRDSAFLVKNGKIAGVVKHIRLVGNALAMLKNITALGKKKKVVKWWEVPFPVEVPHILVKKVHLTKPF